MFSNTTTTGVFSLFTIFFLINDNTAKLVSKIKIFPKQSFEENGIGLQTVESFLNTRKIAKRLRFDSSKFKKPLNNI